MNIKQTILVAVSLTVSLFNQKAEALACGDVITGNTTLSEDLHCTDGFYALEIGADDVTLNLNGYRISGSVDLVGIIVSGRDRVNIIGNGGVISGFWAGVNTVESNFLQVQSTSFYDLAAGVIISSGSNANIKGNDFIQLSSQGVHIVNFLEGQVADNNTVNDNEFFKTRIGIDICGDNSDGNVIKNNLIWLSSNYGIRLIRSDRNKLYNNRILDTTEEAIILQNASRNRLTGNSLQMGRVGLGVFTATEGGCLNSGLNISQRNRFNANHAFNFVTSLVLGNGLSSEGLVRRNDFTGNKLYDNTNGLFFNTDAHDNDVTGNAFTGTTHVVSDLGEGNLY